jgi:hypothetical protein
MTNMRKFGGQGLVKLDDVRDKLFSDRIVGVTESQYGRPVLHFQCGRQFSLNVTNTEKMLKAFGDDDSGWIGQVVELYPGMLSRSGGDQEGVCLRPISKSEHYGDGARRRQPTAPSAAEPELDDFAGPTQEPRRPIEQRSAASSPDIDDDDILF